MLNTPKLITAFCIALTLCLGSTALAQTISPTLFSTSMDPTIKEQVKSDLMLAGSIRFLKTSALHQTLFGKTPSYLRWFKERIKHVSVGNCANNDAAVACVIPLLLPEHMRFTKRYVEMDAPQIARMSVIFHEAKHLEYNPRLHPEDPDLRFWLHVRCPAPFLDENNHERVSVWTGIALSGLEGCDSTPVGSYGLVVIMLNNISKHSTNTSEKLKADAEIYAKDQLIRIIDSSAHDQLLKDE